MNKMHRVRTCEECEELRNRYEVLNHLHQASSLDWNAGTRWITRIHHWETPEA